MPRFKIIVEYDGSNYYGWQRQENLNTIAGQIEKALELFSGKKVTIFGSGRTDAGVHALGQVAHFDLEDDKFSPWKIAEALNFYLQKDQISILDCQEVASDFNCRFLARQRQYEYIILNRRARPTIDKKRVWHVRQELDLELMNQVFKMLVGTHDFSSFRAAECQAKSPIKTIDSIDIARHDQKIIIDVKARSFLHHMVRNIVGSAVVVAQGKMTLQQLEEGFKAKNRELVGPTAPADGLYFKKVIY